jgi:Xaa-Pro dipeptidase
MPLPTDLRPIDAPTRARLLTRLRHAMVTEGRDALLLLDWHSVVWLSGFVHSPNERPVGLLVTLDAPLRLFVPLLEREHALEILPDVETYEEFPGVVPAAVTMLARARALGSRAIAVDTLDASLWTAACDAAPGLAISHAAIRVRAVKEPAELALVRAAARYADATLDAILREGAAVIADGGGEIEILDVGLAAARSLMARELGDRFAPFKTTVVGTAHGGPRAALPHGKTGPRRPLPGEPLIAGIGAAVGGYHAESGATFVVGEAGPDVRHALEAAEACRKAAIDALVVGGRCDAVNDAAHAALRAAGLGAAIRHRIGHGMGIQGHEGPWLSPGDATRIEVGMVFSNEPGIYRPGRDGYRTIDSMIVGSDGVEIPSTFQTRVPWQERLLPLR